MDRYDPHAIERRWQAVWARRAHLGGAEPRRARLRRLEAEVLRARDAALPLGRAPRRPPEELLDRRRDRPLPPPQRLPGHPPDGLRRLRPARPRTTRSRPASTRARPPRRRSPPTASSFAPGASRSTGRARSPPTTPPTTAGPSGSSCACSSAASPTAPRRRCSGVPVDQTVLANEQVIDGHCERCGSLVEPRDLEQWFFRITDYADRLLDDFDAARVLARARGHDAAQLDRPLRGRRGHLPLRGARASTSPSSRPAPTPSSAPPSSSSRPSTPTLERLAAGTGHEAAVRDYVDEPIRETAEERGAEDRAKTGVPLGRTVTNPVNGEQIPMFVADYVLMEYGTGALMAVPGPRRARLRLRHGVRPADPPRSSQPAPTERRRPTRRSSPHRRRGPGQLRASSTACSTRGEARDRRVAAQRRARRARGQLPPARLAALPPALLGLPDPDRLLR